ncbi:MAG: hypothetical protein CME50_07060 [Halieaceae bacterium]|nr:hypothetical protein [Halieaceae bacterium]|tara:strand:+ start:1880 stop:2251 length:372 start_codon:yes stop_codon:yes gene_type:complete
MHHGAALRGPSSGKFTGFRIAEAQQVFGLGNGMHQDNRKTFRERTHFARKAAEAGGLNFVYDTIAKDIGDKIPQGYFGLTFCAQVLGFQGCMQGTFVEHPDMSCFRHYPRLTSTRYATPVREH